jgi:hypothetical protein
MNDSKTENLAASAMHSLSAVMDRRNNPSSGLCL